MPKLRVQRQKLVRSVTLRKYTFLVFVLHLGACGPAPGGPEISEEEKKCRTLAFLSGLGAMASTRTLSAGSAMLQGADAGAQYYGECSS